MTDTTTTSTRRTGTGDGDDRLTELHEQITQGVAALVDSDAWQAMLDIAAKFHPYSLGNLLLIAAQAPAATRVAGFRSWQGMGRQVRKGERGIAILAPCTYRPKPAADTPDSHQPPAAETGGGAAADRRAAAGAWVPPDVRVRHHPDKRAARPGRGPVLLLTGQAPPGLWDNLAGQVTGPGYTLERGDCGGANGYTDPATRTAWVRDDIDPAQAVKTPRRRPTRPPAPSGNGLVTTALYVGTDLAGRPVAAVVTARPTKWTGGTRRPYDRGSVQ